MRAGILEKIKVVATVPAIEHTTTRISKMEKRGRRQDDS